jgi:hypothetical protein
MDERKSNRSIFMALTGVIVENAARTQPAAQVTSEQETT